LQPDLSGALFWFFRFGKPKKAGTEGGKAAKKRKIN